MFDHCIVFIRQAGRVVFARVVLYYQCTTYLCRDIVLFM